MNRAGFTLLETIVAMSLFAAAAVALCQAAVNAHQGLMRLERRQDGPLKLDWIRDDILAMTNRKALEEGGEVVFPQDIRKKPKDGEPQEPVHESVRARWEAEIAPTPILDVHRLTITLTLRQGEQMSEPLVGSYYVYRPGWYEDPDGRNALLKEKQEAWERLQLNRGTQ